MKSLLSHIARTFRLTAAAACIAAEASGASILDIRRDITDSDIIFPESVQTDVHKMQQNWYLRNYTILDTTVTAPVVATDEVIIDRLRSMPTTIEMPFNQVVRSHIDLYVNRRRALVETMLGMSLYYMPIFEEALEREGLPLELRNLPIIESALNPDAVSRAGATGLWQFMLPTARGLGMEINTLVDERRDPVRSSEMAAKYLKQLFSIYKDWSLAIAAYNCGPGNVNKALMRAGATADNPKNFWEIYYNLPAETRGYLPAFIGATYAMTYYADHGISPALARRPILTDTVHIKSRIHFQPIASTLNIPVEELRVLNPQYRQDIIPGDLRPYALRLPSQLVYSYLMFEDSIKSASEALAPRPVVEIGDSRLSADGSVTYKDVTKYHKVRRGETLAKIARKYGVTVSDIKRWNKLKSNKVSRGKRLKIIIREATPVTGTAEPKDSAAKTPADSIAAPGGAPAPADVPSVETEIVEEEADDTAGQADAASASSDAEMADADAQKVIVIDKPARNTAARPSATRHTVRKGDTLYSLSRRYGVTVEQIKRANNMTGSNLHIGQKLKIPKK